MFFLFVSVDRLRYCFEGGGGTCIVSSSRRHSAVMSSTDTVPPNGAGLAVEFRRTGGRADGPLSSALSDAISDRVAASSSAMAIINRSMLVTRDSSCPSVAPSPVCLLV